MKNKNKHQINPEIKREADERRRAQILYDGNEAYGMTLFPYCFGGSTASATECTGLMQTVPLDPAELEAYDSLYSYKQPLPMSDNDTSTDS